ncbi:MAG: glycosyltransferase family 4 protein, partial [Chloroflexi bacterium]|nr:glycosyltransferase family 4 protein [Chloroflexota bacterium]
MMLIGIDASRALTAQRTGTEAYAYFLINALIPLAAKAGHRIRLYVNQTPPSTLFPHNPAVETAVIPFPRLWTHIRLGAELHRNPPDVFFTPSHVLPVSYYGRSVATVHDLAYHHFPEAYTRKQRAYLRWSTRHNSRRSRIVFADSHATKQDLTTFYDTDPAKIEVVYPGIDPLLQPVKDETQITAVCQKYNITSPYLLAIGTLQPRKNLVRLIEAFTDSNIPHQLVLAGNPGWRSQPILDAVKSSVVNRQLSIALPGFVDNADKPALISGATALLYPSLYEGFGFPILEAHACETAVLCANTSSLPEVAADAALFVDPDDIDGMIAAIQRIAQDNTLRADLIQRG